MLIIGAAWYPNLRIHGLITIILVPGMAGDFIPVFTSGTPDSMGPDFMTGFAEASTDRIACCTLARVGDSPLHINVRGAHLNTAISIGTRRGAQSSDILDQAPDVLVCLHFAKGGHAAETNSILHNPE